MTENEKKRKSFILLHFKGQNIILNLPEGINKGCYFAFEIYLFNIIIIIYLSKFKEKFLFHLNNIFFSILILITLTHLHAVKEIT